MKAIVTTLLAVVSAVGLIACGKKEEAKTAPAPVAAPAPAADAASTPAPAVPAAEPKKEEAKK